MTRKITWHAAAIRLGLVDELRLGNLDAERDWGYAQDYVEAMWLMLQRDEPEDFVIATGIAHSVRDCLEIAFDQAGVAVEDHVVIDPSLRAPGRGRPSDRRLQKARALLGWKPTTDFETLIRMMVDADRASCLLRLSAQPRATSDVANSMARMRVRIALVLAFVATATGLVIDMSGSAPRLAGGDTCAGRRGVRGHPVAAGGERPVHRRHGAARRRGADGDDDREPTGTPLPRIAVDFTPTGRRGASGVLARGAGEGAEVSVPLALPARAERPGTLCLHIGGHHPLVVRWMRLGRRRDDGRRAGGRQAVVILYYRPGSESWWQLLGALDLRFGLGKSTIFGDWTLPVIVLAGSPCGSASFAS